MVVLYGKHRKINFTLKNNVKVLKMSLFLRIWGDFSPQKDTFLRIITVFRPVRCLPKRTTIFFSEKVEKSPKINVFRAFCTVLGGLCLRRGAPEVPGSGSQWNRSGRPAGVPRGARKAGRALLALIERLDKAERMSGISGTL